MKKIAKIIRVFFLIGLLLSLTSCGTNKLSNESTLKRVEESDSIVWGVKNDTRLFGLMDIKSGQVQGFDIDIAKALTKEILGDEGKATFVEVTSKTRIPLLKNGNIDAIIATMTITPERKEQVDFSDVYFEAGQSLLVKKGSAIHSIKDLKEGTTVLAVKGSTSVDNIKKAAPKAKILELENYAECFTALKSNQGDVMTTDNAILMGMASESTDYTLVGGNFTNEPYGIAVNKNQEPFLNKINAALKTLHQNGTYDKIYNKWFGDVAN
ncbi:MAG: transporter substrate-binding domain-containing protein [Lactobacillales bacterium]|jgi:putative glutamine transport system substrate-binding protein|nr:transporter substrate-binding domain-containing protein [Lactobacillales bacterium]